MQRIVPLSSLRGRRLLVVFHRPRPREGEGRPPCPFLPSRVLDNSSLALKKAEPARQADCYLEDSARFDGQNLANANRTQRNSSSDPACVASVSVQFRRKERGTRVKDREKSGASKRAGRGWVYHKSPCISLLRNQTETLATQATSWLRQTLSTFSYVRGRLGKNTLSHHFIIADSCKSQKSINCWR